MLLTQYIKKKKIIQKKLNFYNILLNDNEIKKYYLKIIKEINSYNYKNILKIGISGAQGSGKSRFSIILKILIESIINKKVLILSIDDFYLTLKEREKLSNNIHPLFITRGVPGTHDINLINKIINNIELGNLKNIKIPIFSKNLDDRLKKNIKISYIPDIIIIEGWCINTSPLPRKILMKSINIIEKKFDKNYVWRQYYNNQLKNYYKDLFLKLNFNIFLKVPNYKKIFKWKQLQEKKLSKNNIINQKKLKYFIMHYEKITKWMINNYYNTSDICLNINNQHNFCKIIFNKEH